MLDGSILYADYQATAPLDPRIAACMTPYLAEAFGNPHSVDHAVAEAFGNPHSVDHAVGWRAGKAVCEAAEAVAGLIGAEPDEIVFTSGATESNNLALFGLARRAVPSRRRILASAIEHKCVLAAVRGLAAREGFATDLLPVDQEGTVDLDELERRLDEDVLVVSIMAVNNEVGTIQDIPRIAELLADRGILFHCDAAQAPCAMDVRDLALHADMISLSAHKMHGPQGIGALAVRRDLQDRIEPLIHGGGQQNGLRSGTVPLPLCVGFGAAARIIAEAGAAEERARVARQRDNFIHFLRAGGAPVSLNGPAGKCRHPGNANLRFDGLDAKDILGVLQPKLAASTGSACASGIPEPSHVLRALGLSAEESDASIRFSFGRFTTDDEIAAASTLVLTALSSLASGDQLVS